MQTIRCVVVDDEPLALKMMCAYVEKTPGLELYGAFSNSAEALEFLRSEPVQLAFLDIQMPGLNGLELSTLIEDRPLRIVFVTAFEQYALQGFKANALDYLLKPASYDDFMRAVKRAQAWFGRDDAGAGQNDGQNAFFRSDSAHKDGFFVRADYRWVHIRVEDILFVESDKDYVKIHLDPEGRSRQDTPGSPFCVMTLQCLKVLEEKLSQEDFVRVHRSFLVNLNRVASIEKSRVVFAGGQAVPVSDSYRQALDSRISGRSL
ncbi:MAG: LytTR family DNA-binding domain-containing protein [Bacteroides sp.]|nr:LytTR family DNA-binding domain-containing protein [Ruminococcus flavefaciens]MCM1554204.1 LytTR family DNA-binding domain-containing protein [Bacteroides sp.]